MADPSNAEDDFPDDEGEGGGGESTVSMASPTYDPSMPMPISVPPPAMTPPGGALPNMSIPTAPVPFTPSGPASPAGMPQGARPQQPGPSVPTPFGGLTPSGPGSAPKPLPAAGAPPPGVAGARAPVTSAEGAGAGGIAGMKRPQTVIGLAPPPVGAPRPGAPGGGARGVPLPSGRTSPPRPAVGAAAAAAPAPLSEKGPPSSGRGVKPPAVPASSPKPIAPPSSSGKAPPDADSTDRNLAQTEIDTPDSQKEDQPTMAKSLGESLALFGLDSGLTDAARAAVVPKPGNTPPQPPVGAAPGRSPLATSLVTNNKPAAGAPPPMPPVPVPPPPAAMMQMTEPLPVLHDRTEEEESTRAVSREEMLRGHDAVIMPEDGEAAQGEDATLAVMPGLNEAANSKHLAALAETLGQPGGPPPSNPQPFDPGFPPNLQQPPQPGYPQQQYPQQGYPQDPNQQYYAQSQVPQQQWGQQQDPYAQQQNWNQHYPGSVGPVSGPHMPAQAPISQPHFPGAAPQMPQSSPHLQVPQSGHHPTQHSAQQQMGMPGGPIPYPGQPMMHQPQSSPNPFGDWQGQQQQAQGQGTLLGGKKPFKISGQIILLGAVGLVCLAIFITGIILFATTKF